MNLLRSRHVRVTLLRVSVTLQRCVSDSELVCSRRAIDKLINASSASKLFRSVVDGWWLTHHVTKTLELCRNYSSIRGGPIVRRRRPLPSKLSASGREAKRMTAKQPKRQADMEKCEQGDGERVRGTWWRMVCRENHECGANVICHAAGQAIYYSQLSSAAQNSAGYGRSGVYSRCLSVGLSVRLSESSHCRSTLSRQSQTTS